MLVLLLCIAACSPGSLAGVPLTRDLMKLSAGIIPNTTHWTSTGRIYMGDVIEHQTDAGEEGGVPMNRFVRTDSEQKEFFFNFAHQKENEIPQKDFSFADMTAQSDLPTLEFLATEWRRLCPKVLQFEASAMDDELHNWPAVLVALSRCCDQPPEGTQYQRQLPPSPDSVDFMCTLYSLLPTRANGARSTDISSTTPSESRTSEPVNNSDDLGLAITEVTSAEMRTVSSRVEQNAIKNESWELTEEDLRTATKGSLEAHFLFLQKLKLKLVSEVLNFKKRLIKMVIA